jgi:hypothetical protein
VNKGHLDRLITDALAIEAQDAKEAGALGYTARALVQATLPHSKPAGNESERNGALTPAPCCLPFRPVVPPASREASTRAG